MKLTLFTNSLIALGAIANAAPTEPAGLASPVNVLKREPIRAPRVKSSFGTRDLEARSPAQAPRVRLSFGTRDLEEREPIRAPRVKSSFGTRDLDAREPIRAPRVKSSFGTRDLEEREPIQAPRVKSSFGTRDLEAREPIRAPRVKSSFGTRDLEARAPVQAPRIRLSFGNRRSLTDQDPALFPVMEKRGSEESSTSAPMAEEGETMAEDDEYATVSVNGQTVEIPMGDIMAVDDFSADGSVSSMSTDAGSCMAMAVEDGTVQFLPFTADMGFDATDAPRRVTELLLWCQTDSFDDAALDALS